MPGLNRRPLEPARLDLSPSRVSPPAAVVAVRVVASSEQTEPTVSPAAEAMGAETEARAAAGPEAAAAAGAAATEAEAATEAAAAAAAAGAAAEVAEAAEAAAAEELWSAG
jgi:hypothetical protein